jgi:hypothetical protein
MRSGAVMLAALVMFAAVQAPLAAAQLRPGERLEYTFSFRGIITGFASLDIAHAVISVAEEADSIQGREVYLASLDLSTAPFDKAEMLYPIRYRYRTWLEPGGQMPLLVNEYLETDEVSEELLWFDRDNLMGYRYVKQDDPPEQVRLPPEHLLAKINRSEGDGSLLVQENQLGISDGAVWDYLSMLFRLRYLELAAGRVFHLPLYNGKRIKEYRIEVARETLNLGPDCDRTAFRLSLREIRKGRSASTTVTRVWVSDDEDRLPLRFYVERSIGAVEGILQTERSVSSAERGFSPATQRSLDLIL